MEDSVLTPGAGAAAPLDPFHAALKARYERVALKSLDLLERVLDRAGAADALAVEAPSDQNCAAADRAVGQAGALVSKLVWAHHTLIALRARALDGSIDRPRASRPATGFQDVEAGPALAAMAAGQGDGAAPARPVPTPINPAAATPESLLCGGPLRAGQPAEGALAGGALAGGDGALPSDDRAVRHDADARSRAVSHDADHTALQTALDLALRLNRAGDGLTAGDPVATARWPDLPGFMEAGENRGRRDAVPERPPDPVSDPAPKSVPRPEPALVAD